jgi:ABC-type branched-subunit amino acid transport system substrate-binding protein
LAEAAPPLSVAEQRGKRIYTEGIGRKVITATLAGPGLKLDSRELACAKCHGEDGRGGKEGGVFAADITASAVKLGGAKRPAYNAKTLLEAITQGVGAHGSALHSIMPRYRLSKGDAVDLLAYLARLGTEPVPGVTDNEIRVATLQPRQGALAPAGASIERLLNAYFERINSKGGIYGRRLTLDVMAADSEPSEVLRALREERVLCMLANLAGEDSVVGALLNAQQVPVLAPLRPAAEPIDDANRNHYFVYASLYDQARVLVDHAVATTGGDANFGVIHAADPLARSAAQGARQQVRQHARQMGFSHRFDVQLDAARVMSAARDQGITHLFFFGRSSDFQQLAHAAHAQRYAPALYASADLVGVQPALAKLSDELYLVSSIFPADLTDGEAQEFLELVEREQLPAAQRAFLLPGYAGARMLEAALRQSGRELTRARLRANLEGTSKIATGVTPPLNFNSGRRTGMASAGIMRSHRASARYVPVREFRAPED